MGSGSIVRRKQVPHTETEGLHDPLGWATSEAVKQNATVLSKAEAQAVPRPVVVALAPGRPPIAGRLYVVQTPENPLDEFGQHQ